MAEMILDAVGEPGRLHVACITVEREVEHGSRSPERDESADPAISL
jgi:hypothetical protein